MALNPTHVCTDLVEFGGNLLSKNERSRGKGARVFRFVRFIWFGTHNDKTINQHGKSVLFVSISMFVYLL